MMSIYLNVANINIMSKTYFYSTLPPKHNSITAVILTIISLDNHLSHSCWIGAHD